MHFLKMQRKVRSAAHARPRLQRPWALRELKAMLCIEVVSYPSSLRAEQMQIPCYVSTVELGKTEQLHPQTDRLNRCEFWTQSSWHVPSHRKLT